MPMLDTQDFAHAEVAKKVLTSQDRKDIPHHDFAIPEKAPGSGSYPIADKAHAQNALARCSGKPEEARVRKAVYRKFPELKGTGSGYADMTSKLAPSDMYPDNGFRHPEMVSKCDYAMHNSDIDKMGKCTHCGGMKKKK